MLVLTCQKIIRKQDNKQAKSQVIVELIKSKYQDVSCGCRLKEMIQDLRKEYGVDITYVRDWMAREVALLLMVRGSPREFYTLLARYEKALKISNPST